MKKAEKTEMVKRAFERIGLLAPDMIYERYLEFYQRVINEWNMENKKEIKR